MSLQLIRYRNLFNKDLPKLLAVSTRLAHINHPGHRKKPPAYPIKYELPDKYLDEAVYPPVKPKFPPGDWLNDADTKLAWIYFDEGQKYHSLKTIQERLSILAYLNVQQTITELKERGTRYYPIYKISSLFKTPRMLPFNQYITKTYVASVVKNLPSISAGENEKTQLNKNIDADLYEKLKYHVKESILLNFAKQKELKAYEPPENPETYKPDIIEKEKRANEAYLKSNSLIKDIFDTTTSILSVSESNKHLLYAQYGNNVSIKSYWKRCGFEPQKPRGAVIPDLDNIRFQYDDVASYQIKTDKPLRPLFKLNDQACSEANVAKLAEDGSIQNFSDYAYKPAIYKVFADHVLPMQVPGHWYGDQREFNYLTVFNTNKQMSYFKEKFPDLSEDLDLLKSIAVQLGHAELTAQAYYLGFSMWKDITYPLLGQFVLTNGQDFSFANYQLNTIRLWNKGTPLTNLCYLTKPERLFKLNGDQTQLTDFNEDLFKSLINMLTVQPIAKDEEIFENYSEIDYMIGGTRLRPYLSIQNFNEQLSKRRQIFATSLYELVKYDKPMNYLDYRCDHKPESYKPHFVKVYNKLTHDFRDIVLNYYPRDYYGLKLLERMIIPHPKNTTKFWDLKTPVFEWANVPPPDINNIPRKIDLPKF